MRAFEPGELLKDTYRIVGGLDAGGMGQVYLANHVALGHQVCVKTLNIKADFSEASLPQYRKRFEREARALLRLKHPSIVTLYDFGIHDDTPFLVMEYFRNGRPALAWGNSMKPSQKQWLLVFRQLFDSLHHAHLRGVLHRDIKSGNFLVRGAAVAAEACLIDFGIAFDSHNSTLTQANAILGTTGNIDPAKLADPGRPFTPQSDLYGAGALLYYALCGRAPVVFPKDASPMDRFQLALQNVVAPPRSLDATLSEDVDAFLLALLATAPEDRPPSGAACVAVIDALLADAPISLSALRATFPPVQLEEHDSEDDVPLLEAELVEAPPSKATKKERAAVAAAEVRKPESRVSLALSAAEVVHVPVSEPAANKPRSFVAAAFSFVGERPRIGNHRQIIFALVGLLIVLCGAGVIVAAQRSHHQEKPALPPLVTAAELEHSRSPDKAAIDRIIATRAPDPTITDSRLDSFHRDIKARYPVSAPGDQLPAPASQPIPIPLRKSVKETPPPAAPPVPEPVSLGIIPPSPLQANEKPDAKAETPAVPHGTKTTVYLLDVLDTSSAEPVRAELRASLRVGSQVILPVGTVLLGRAALKNTRAQATFDRAVRADGTELPIRAVAITPDGREGILGGQYEYGDDPSSGAAGAVVADVVGSAALDLASAAIPGSDTFSRSARKALSNEATKSRHIKDEPPRKRDRMTLQQGAKLLVQFRAR